MSFGFFLAAIYIAIQFKVQGLYFGFLICVPMTLPSYLYPPAQDSNRWFKSCSCTSREHFTLNWPTFLLSFHQITAGDICWAYTGCQTCTELFYRASLSILLNAIEYINSTKLSKHKLKCPLINEQNVTLFGFNSKTLVNIK